MRVSTRVAFTAVALAGAMAAASCSLGGGGEPEQQPAARDDDVDAAPGVREVALGPARVRVRRHANGLVCYVALRTPSVRPSGTLLRGCVKQLREHEIAYVLAPRGTGQLMLAGVAGADVSRVVVRLRPSRTWRPRLEDGAFFGYVPSGYTAEEVVKILDDGSSESFAVEAAR